MTGRGPIARVRASSRGERLSATALAVGVLGAAYSVGQGPDQWLNWAFAGLFLGVCWGLSRLALRTGGPGEIDPRRRRPTADAADVSSPPRSSGGPSAAAIVDRVARALTGSPYTVRPTAAGFDVALDLRGSGRWGPTAHQLGHTVVHHVALDGATGRFTVTDEVRDVHWHGDVADFGASRGVTRGRVRTSSVGVDSVAGPWSFDSEKVRTQVVDLLVAAGWSQQRSREATIGIAVACASAGLAVLVGLALAVVALTGGFSG